MCEGWSLDWSGGITYQTRKCERVIDIKEHNGVLDGTLIERRDHSGSSRHFGGGEEVQWVKRRGR